MVCRSTIRIRGSGGGHFLREFKDESVEEQWSAVPRFDEILTPIPPRSRRRGGDLEGFIGFRAHMRAVADDEHQLQV